MVLDDGGLVLVGGFTERLRATAAVQRRDPRSGWEPIGTSLLTPRSSPLVAPLPDDRLLVVGGWTGTLPHEVVHLGDAELCDPRRPERRRALPAPFPERTSPGLEGAAMCTLADGRILLLHDHDLAVFDPATLAWSSTHRHRHARRFGDVLPLADGSALMIGGGRDGTPAVESIRWTEAGGIEVTPWDAPIDPELRHAATFVLDEREILVAGGEIDGRSVAETWVLNVAKACADPVAPLPIEGGLSRGTLVRIDDRIVLVGGETVEGRFPSPPANGAVLRPPWTRPHVLVASPTSAVRTMVVPRPRGVVVVGGYRFDASETGVARIQVHRAASEMSLPVFAVVD